MSDKKELNKEDLENINGGSEKEENRQDIESVIITGQNQEKPDGAVWIGGTE